MTTHAPETSGKVLLDAEALSRTLSRIAHEIIEGNPDLDEVALVGIHTRGVPLAQRPRRLIEGRGGPPGARPVGRPPRLDFPIEGRTCILVDDVLYTARTIRAALDALFDY